MTKEKKQDIISFYTLHPDLFSAFVYNLLIGKACWWRGKILTDQETTEIYQAMREVFPGRKDG